MLIPKLRFKREDGTDYPEWEDWVLDSIGSFYGGLSGKTKEDFGKGNSKFVTYMNVYKNIFAMQEMLESVDISDNEKQNKVKYGDLLMTQSSETVEELGMSSVYLFYDEPYLNSFCFGLHLYNHALTYPMYIGYLMRSEAIRKQIMREGQGISRINLSPNRMKGMILSLPCLEEQQKIADFLSNVDEVIAQSEAEVANLQQQKKAAMQKIFSQKVRFKREDGTSYPEWEELPLGQIVEQNNIPVENPGSNYVKLAIRSHCKGTFHKPINSKEDGLDVDKMYLVEANNLIVNITFAWEHAIAITKPEDAGTYVSHRFPQYKFVNGNIPAFYAYVIKNPRMKYEMGLCSPGGAGRNRVLKQNDFLLIPMARPCIEEQQKIADFLATYDEAISCAKQELDKWKELKKGLLQQMFA